MFGALESICNDGDVGRVPVLGAYSPSPDGDDRGVRTETAEQGDVGRWEYSSSDGVECFGATDKNLSIRDTGWLEKQLEESLFWEGSPLGTSENETL